ncbi:MAG: DUF1700 domain-containing protein [Lachnospiraceae bacterium]|nr:DUF1700 domain-containing protein [Lachnospiraceae bacterium]
MTKEEFLEQLEDALVGEVPNAVIYDNKRYYERYFFSEMKQGRTEAEILEELGSPRLIARTIIDMQGDAKQQYRESAYYKDDVREEFEKSRPHLGGLDLTTWYGRALAWVIGIFILLLLIWLISGILSVAIQVAIPLLGVFAVYSLIKAVMRK